MARIFSSWGFNICSKLGLKSKWFGYTNSLLYMPVWASDREAALPAQPDKNTLSFQCGVSPDWAFAGAGFASVLTLVSDAQSETVDAFIYRRWNFFNVSFKNIFSFELLVHLVLSKSQDINMCGIWSSLC